MAKLRKMLGSAKDPSVIALMELMNTQSKTTLARWAVTYAKTQILTICKRHFPEETCFSNAVTAALGYLDGTQTLSAAKPFLKTAAEAARALDGQPIAQAAARAVPTACAAIQTPTNALGFTFYAAAALVYEQFGLNKPPAVYDQEAAKILQTMLEEFRLVMLPDEANPAKLNWNC